MNEPRENNTLKQLTVSDLMTTHVQSVPPDSSIRDAHSRMRLSGIRHLPVLSAAGELVGVLSDRDLHIGWAQGPDTRVSTVMSVYATRATPSTTAREAAARLLHDKIGCLPVLDDSGALVGIITETDFLKIAHRALTVVEMLARDAQSDPQEAQRHVH